MVLFGAGSDYLSREAHTTAWPKLYPEEKCLHLPVPRELTIQWLNFLPDRRLPDLEWNPKGNADSFCCLCFVPRPGTHLSLIKTKLSKQKTSSNAPA